MSNQEKYNNTLFNRDELKIDLRRRSVQSGMIRVITNGTATLLSIISAIILARILSPKEFGLAAMVFVVTDFARVFTEMGLGTATVQMKDITHDEVSNLFWINIGIGLISMLFVAGLSPVIAWFYGESQLISICLVLSGIFLFRGLTVQHRSLLERQMRFGALGIINIGSNICGISAALLMALNGYGVWALVWREILFAAFYAAGIWIFCRWLPGLPNRKFGVMASLRFGADISIVSIFQYFTQRTDRILIGRFFGAAPLGIYSKAQQLSQMVLEYIQMTILGMGLAPLSAIKDEKSRYCRFYEKLLSILSFFCMPLMVLLAIQAENIILLLLGERWLEAAPILRIFTIAGFITPVVSSFQLVMISCGETRRYLVWGCVKCALMMSAYAIGISWGISGIAYSYTAACYIFLAWSLSYALKNTPVNVRLVVKVVAMPIMSSAVSGIAMLSLLNQLADANAFKSVAFSAIFISLVYIAFWLSVPGGRRQLQEFWAYGAMIFKKA